MNVLNVGIITECQPHGVVLEQRMAEYGDGEVRADDVGRNVDECAVSQQFDLIDALDPVQAVEDRLVHGRA